MASSALSNTRFSLAVHLMTMLSVYREELQSSTRLAEAIGTNPSFLRQLIGKLRAAHLVETKLGKGGGIALAREPETIRLLDIYRATEDRPALCVHECESDASHESDCSLGDSMSRLFKDLNWRLENAVQAELAAVSMADLVKTYVPGAS